MSVGKDGEGPQEHSRPVLAQVLEKAEPEAKIQYDISFRSSKPRAMRVRRKGGGRQGQM